MNNQSLVDDLLNRGVFFQINLMSLTGHYSSAVKKMAEKLIKRGFVHFFGSDIHNPGHLEIVKRAYSNRYLQEVKSQVLNNTLI
jgi:tyrosine-protein phosphatase YwqE